MKTQKILLDIEDEDENISLGLARLAMDIPPHELFFDINTINSFNFMRIDDLVYHGEYFEYHFPRFQAFHHDSKVCIHFIGNKCCHSKQKKIATELFSGEFENKYLLEHFQDVDYIIKTSEPFNDFSLILLPENLMFQIQDFTLSSEEELYHIFQYYE